MYFPSNFSSGTCNVDSSSYSGSYCSECHAGSFQAEDEAPDAKTKTGQDNGIEQTEQEKAVAMLKVIASHR